MRIRFKHLFTAVLASAVVASVTACAGGGTETTADGKQKIKVTLTSTALSSAPVLAAIAEDTFADHGLAVEWTEVGGDSTKAIATVTRGQAEFATAGTATVLDSMKEGLPLRLIANVERPALTIALRKDVADRVAKETGVTPDAPIEERVQALKGLKFGAHPPGATNYTLLRAILDKYEVDANKDLELLPSDQRTVASSLKAGKFDAAMWSAGPLETLGEDEAVEWIATADGDLGSFKDYLYMGAIASEEMLESDPELTDKFVSSVRDGAELVLADDADTRAAVKKKFFPTLSKGAYERTWKSAKEATVPSQGFTTREFEYTVDVTKSVYQRDYSKLSFTEIVPKFARAD